MPELGPSGLNGDNVPDSVAAEQLFALESVLSEVPAGMSENSFGDVKVALHLLINIGQEIAPTADHNFTMQC